MKREALNIISKHELFHSIYQKFGNKFLVCLIDNKTSFNSNIKIECQIHGCCIRKIQTFLSSVYGCYSCGIEARNKSNSKNAESMEIPLEIHIEKFNKIYNNFYTYPGTYQIKAGRKKIDIICSDHGPFSKHISAHIKGSGCPKCQREGNTYKSRLMTEEEIILKKTEISRRKNEGYKKRTLKSDVIKKRFMDVHKEKFEYYWDSFVNIRTEMKILCPFHGIFYQRPDYHLKSNHGCQKCSNGTNQSLEERIWLDKFDNIETQYRINLENSYVIVDGYDSISNTIYEFLGDFWHGNPRIYKEGLNRKNKKPYKDLFIETEDRINKLYKHQYKIVYVWENDIKNNIFKREFKGRLEY